MHFLKILTDGRFSAEFEKVNPQHLLLTIRANDMDLISAVRNLEKDLNVSFSNLQFASRKYRRASSIVKRAVVGAVYPNNLTYNEG